MKKVSDILNHKGKKMISVPPEASVIDALRIMAESNIGSVMVVKDSNYLGLMTERDYSRKIALKGKSSSDTNVSEIMSTDIPKVSPEDTIDHCMELMTVENVRYLPVFQSGELIGIVSINDVVRETILSQQETISSLKDYLYSSG
jgi:CBS domain-containing protein